MSYLKVGIILNIYMNALPDNIYIKILKYTFPLNEINNSDIGDTINNILTKNGYCYKCGEINRSINCIYCNTILYYYCKSCLFCKGDCLVCCVDSYKNNGMYNYNM